VPLISNTIGFLVAVLLARALGPDGRGILALFTSAVSIAFALFNWYRRRRLLLPGRKEVSEREATQAGLDVSLVAALLTAASAAVTAWRSRHLLEGRTCPTGSQCWPCPCSSSSASSAPSWPGAQAGSGR
jgi:hypothetical protein